MQDKLSCRDLELPLSPKLYQNMNKRPRIDKSRTESGEQNKKYSKPRSGSSAKGIDRSYPSKRSDKPRADEADRYKRGAKPPRSSAVYSQKPQRGRYTKSTEKDPAKSKFGADLQAEVIRLNKFLADAGVCSRREADKLIEAGVVTVNGKTVTELGTKVSIHDKVVYGGQLLRREKLQYVLLNKPKDYITTMDDPYDRKTVMELVKKACNERIYPVGRLDRNTLGLLLLTNDGDLAKKLTHPRHNVSKMYHVILDKPLTKNDMLRIAAGIELEDGIAMVDAISYVAAAEAKNEVGVQLHSGKNRIVRRIFEHLGYQVVKLDRVEYAGLTKFNLPRGRWRHLTPSEISQLKRIR